MVGFINLKFIDYDKDGNITVQYDSYSPVGSISPDVRHRRHLCTPFNSYAIGLSS